jgi:methionyl-tRNA synthetase
MIEAEPKKKFETKLAHPTYVIEECPSCGFPEADGGYCPECGWFVVHPDCPHCKKLATI